MQFATKMKQNGRLHEDGIHELSSINRITVNSGPISYSKIPEHREIG